MPCHFYTSGIKSVSQILAHLQISNIFGPNLKSQVYKVQTSQLRHSVIFVNENENYQKGKNNDSVNEN